MGAPQRRRLQSCQAVEAFLPSLLEERDRGLGLQSGMAVQGKVRGGTVW